MQLATAVDNGSLLRTAVFFKSLLWDLLPTVVVAKNLFLVGMDDEEYEAEKEAV